MAIDDIQHSPDLPLAQLAQGYAVEKFVQIPNFLDDAMAAQIETKLRTETPWRLIYVDPQRGVRQISRAEAQQIGGPGMQEIMRSVLQSATRNIGYCYNGYHLTMGADAVAQEAPLLHSVAAYLNSSAFLRFVETVIGETGLTRTDAQATLFTPGNFLTRHIDDAENDARRVAYTLSFCRNWQTDWGGQLQFIDQKTTDVTSAWIPRWNTLTLFDVRKVHSVSPVSNFAGDGRYSVVGWVRND